MISRSLDGSLSSLEYLFVKTLDVYAKCFLQYLRDDHVALLFLNFNDHDLWLHNSIKFTARPWIHVKTKIKKDYPAVQYAAWTVLHSFPLAIIFLCYRYHEVVMLMNHIL